MLGTELQSVLFTAEPSIQLSFTYLELYYYISYFSYCCDIFDKSSLRKDSFVLAPCSRVQSVCHGGK